MDNNTKRLLDELSHFVPSKSKHLIVESKAENVIASFSNLVELINETFEQDESEELVRRLYIAIKNNNPERFLSKIRDLKKGE